MINFILGIVFVALGIPVLQYLSDIFNGLTQWFIAYCSAHISQYNKYVNDLQANEQGEKSNAIGFQLPNENECEDDE